MLDIRTAIPTPRATPAPILPGSMTGDAQVGQADVQSRRLAAERALDEVLAQSFPASDPPSWTLGIVRPNTVVRAAGNGVRGSIVASADQSASAAVGDIDVSRPSGERTFIDALISLAAACGIVLLVPFVILLVGLPIALLVRGFIEAVSWLLALIIP